MNKQQDDFFSTLAAVLNSEQSRSVILSGNVYDLFAADDEYLPLIPYLSKKSQVNGLIRVVYEINGPIRILDDRDKVKNAWISWKAGVDLDTLLIKGLKEKGQSELDRLAAQFDALLLEAIEKPALALELLRQLTICSRTTRLSGNLLIFVEAADMLLPAGDGDIASLNDRQMRRISICQDWFGDPAFMNGGDSVVLIAESRSLIHPRVSALAPGACGGDPVARHGGPSGIRQPRDRQRGSQAAAVVHARRVSGVHRRTFAPRRASVTGWRGLQRSRTAPRRPDR